MTSSADLDDHQIFCSELESTKSTGGIFFNHDPFVRCNSAYIAQLILVSLFSQVLYAILKPLKQTKFVSWTLAGIALGPSGLGRWTLLRDKLFPPGHELLPNTTSTIGITLFTFVCAVKTDVGMIPKLAKNAIVIGATTVLLPVIVILSIVALMGPNLVQDNVSLFFVAGIACMTQFQNLCVALDEMNVLTSRLGRLALTVSYSNEILPWSIIIFSNISMAKSYSSTFGAAMSTVSIIMFTVFVARPCFLSIIRKTPHGRPVSDVYVINIIIGITIMMLLSQVVGLMNLGVVFLGLAIPDGPPLGSTVIEKMELVVMELFMPLLYVSLGSSMDFSKVVDWGTFRMVVIVIVASIFAKLFTTILSATLLCKLDLRSSCLLAIMLSIKGPVDMFVLTLKIQKKSLDDQGYVAVVLCSVVITAIITPLIQVFYNINVRSSELAGGAKIRTIDTSNKVEFTALCCMHSEDNVPGIITIISAFTSASTTARNSSTFVLVHLLELVGSALPVITPYKENKKAKRLSTYYIMKAFENYWNQVNHTVSFESYQIIAPYKTMHENICQLAIDRSVPVIIVPLHYKKEEANTLTATWSQNLIMNLQQSANCTVGILVEKGSYHHNRIILDNKCTCRIAVLFIGGADDREGLVFAACMSRNSHVSITLLHIIPPAPNAEEKVDMIDKRLNEATMDRFKEQTIGQPDRNVVCKEVRVKDIEETFNAIKTLEDGYDLIVVGKEHRTVYPDEMLNWNEHPELGVIGDLLASEALQRKTAVVVLQHPRNTRHPITHKSSDQYDTV